MDAIETRSDIRTRLIPATPSQLFAAMRDPSRVARWWGPEGFTSTIHEFQFEPAGKWRLTLHGPDGKAYPNEYRVVRIEADRLLEVDHPSDDHHFSLIIRLVQQGEATLVAWQQTFDTVEHYRPLADFLAQANEQVLQRLAAQACMEPSALRRSCPHPLPTPEPEALNDGQVPCLLPRPGDAGPRP